MVKEDVVAAAPSKGGKAKKKKWSKAKVKERINNQVLFDKSTYDKLNKEVPTMKLITPSVLSDRFRINGSLARAVIKELEAKGVIKVVAHHHSQIIYTRSAAAALAAEAAEKAAAEKAAAGKAKKAGAPAGKPVKAAAKPAAAKPAAAKAEPKKADE
eukprot:TRINITY_DN3693_c0_g1_i1.p2 TRINITY_DN3693_c0_g1~~TRINITY_DN3693_c0_g1_i1.p2  ORF type:complete len:175 (+),score=55.88 TRINITY_DN3693_c0_g1_i1:55-525(+)